jgi:hypothetical protein
MRVVAPELIMDLLGYLVPIVVFAYGLILSSAVAVTLQSESDVAAQCSHLTVEAVG